MSNYLQILLPLAVVFSVLLFTKAGRDFVTRLVEQARHAGGLPYRPRAVMTDNELDFHATLRAALPDPSWELWPQVSMAAFIAPKNEAAARDPARKKDFWASYGKIANARVDWLIARDGRAFCVIELDDRTHQLSKDVERDAIVAAAGLPTLRFHSQRKPDAALVRARLRALAA